MDGYEVYKTYLAIKLHLQEMTIILISIMVGLGLLMIPLTKEMIVSFFIVLVRSIRLILSIFLFLVLYAIILLGWETLTAPQQNKNTYSMLNAEMVSHTISS